MLYWRCQQEQTEVEEQKSPNSRVLLHTVYVTHRDFPESLFPMRWLYVNTASLNKVRRGSRRAYPKSTENMKLRAKKGYFRGKIV